MNEEWNPEEGEILRPYGDIELNFRPSPPPEPVAMLYVENNVLKFSGNMDQAAFMLFDQYLRPMCDHYIRERLEEIAQINRGGRNGRES